MLQIFLYILHTDFAPLLNNHQQTGSENSDSKPLTNSSKSSEVEEEDQVETFNDNLGAVLVNLLTSLRHLPVGMHSVLIVMALTWVIVMVPFFLFDTDWMGREVYHGDPKGDANKVQAYDEGVREGAFGLLLNSVSTRVVLGIRSFRIEPMCQWMGSRGFLIFVFAKFAGYVSISTSDVMFLLLPFIVKSQ
uniref:Uncharacterized protein n=1 Tax=Lactuca sativa TaxID=4236 RepID=A0A9R1WKA9_LACSA|nr:hypothetical protein LSAT_V11C100044540 [Lactuca sativa]